MITYLFQLFFFAGLIFTATRTPALFETCCLSSPLKIQNNTLKIKLAKLILNPTRINIETFNQESHQLLTELTNNWSLEVTSDQSIAVHSLMPRHQYNVTAELVRGIGFVIYFASTDHAVSYSIEEDRTELRISQRSRGEKLEEVQGETRLQGIIRLNAALAHARGNNEDSTVSELEKELDLAVNDFNETKFRVITGARTQWQTTPMPLNHLGFKGLHPKTTYQVSVRVGKGHACTVHFSSKNHSVIYNVDSFDAAQQHRTTLIYLIAKRVGNGKNLQQLTNHRLLKKIIQLTADLKTARLSAGDIETPQVLKMRAELQKIVSSFPDAGLLIKTPPTGRFTITPVIHNVISFNGLTPTTEYRIVPRWEPGIGPILYFESMDNHSFRVYSVDSYRGYVLSDQIQTHKTAVPLANGETLQQTRAQLQIKKAIQYDADIRKIEQSAQPKETIRTLISQYRHKIQEIEEICHPEGFFIETDRSATWMITPVSQNELGFLLLPHQKYFISFHWEEGIGLIVYFKSENETMGFNVKSYQDYDEPTETIKICYGWREVREQKMENARKLVQLQGIVRLWADAKKIELAEDKADTKNDLLKKIESAITTYGKEGITIQSNDSARWIFTPFPGNWITFHLKQSASSFRILPILNSDMGLIFIFEGDRKVRAHSVDAYQNYEENGTRNTFRALLLDEADTTANLIGKLYMQRLIQHQANFLRGKEAGNASEHIRTQIIAEITPFNQQRMTIQTTKDGDWITTPVKNNSLFFRKLSPRERYHVQARWDDALGLVFSFSSIKHIRVYTVENYQGYDPARTKYKGFTATSRFERMGVLQIWLQIQKLMSKDHSQKEEEIANLRFQLYKEIEYIKENILCVASDDNGIAPSPDSAIPPFEDLSPETTYQVFPVSDGSQLWIYLIGPNTISEFLASADTASQEYAIKHTHLKSFPWINHQRIDSKASAVGGPKNGSEGMMTDVEKLIIEKTNNGQTTVSSNENGEIIIAPSSNHSIRFKYLLPYLPYRVLACREKDIGLRIYFVHETGTWCYSLDSYTRAISTPTQSRLYAAVLRVKANTLFEARQKMIDIEWARTIGVRGYLLMLMSAGQRFIPGENGENSFLLSLRAYIGHKQVQTTLEKLGYSTEEKEYLLTAAELSFGGIGETIISDHLRIDNPRWVRFHLERLKQVFSRVAFLRYVDSAL